MTAWMHGAELLLHDGSARDPDSIRPQLSVLSTVRAVRTRSLYLQPETG